MLSNITRDIRRAARRSAAGPGFTAAAVLTIALGVGLNTGVFSVLNGIFLSGLPVPAAHELVDIYAAVDGVAGRNENGRLNPRVTTGEYELFRDGATSLAGLMGYSLPWPALLGGDASRQITGRYVTCNYFEVLRQPPAAGRPLTQDDCAAGAAPVVMLGHGLWMRAFAGDPAVVGQTITLNGRPITVAGIAAEDALQPDLQRVDYFAPISTQPYLRPDRQWLVSDVSGWLTLVGRRTADGTLDQVRAELGVVAARIDAQHPGRSTIVHADSATLPTNQPGARNGGGSVVAAAAAAFGLVLLVACANVANLFLARVASRTSEIALRFSLGASRSRVVRELLTEVLLVSLAGGALGVALAFLFFEPVVGVALSSLPLVLPELELDLRVLSFALGLSIAAGVAAGLGPALGVTRADLRAAITSKPAGGPRHAGGGLQAVLIGAQVGVCVVLLIAAGLLLRGLHSVNNVDPGFPYGEVAVVTGDLRDLGYTGEALASVQRRLHEEIGALPGVEAVGYTVDPPWSDRALRQRVRVTQQGDAAYTPSARNHVSGDYFAAVGIPIVRGRTFADAELAETSTAVIVTEATAARFWPGQDPVGRTLLAAAGGEADRALEVVGVARDAQVSRIGEVDSSYLYLPPQRDFRHMQSLVVRSRLDYAALEGELRAALRRLDVALHVTALEANLAGPRGLSAVLSGLAVSLGVLTLVLASIGIFGVVSYVVNLRRREIGIRLALGAKSRDVHRAILGRTLRPVVAGAALGCVGAVAASNVLAGMLFGVSPADPIGILGAVAFVLAIALVASAIPAWRGLRVDPMTTLRSE